MPGRPAHVQQFINKMFPSAFVVRTIWKVPVSVLIAQSALETGWGKHAPGNAYFGIKGTNRSGGAATYQTTEVVGGTAATTKAKFRQYSGVLESATDYGAFLSSQPRYAEAFKHTDDPYRFVELIAAGGYATDPNYAKKVQSIIRHYNLTQYDSFFGAVKEFLGSEQTQKKPHATTAASGRSTPAK